MVVLTSLLAIVEEKLGLGGFSLEHSEKAAKKIEQVNARNHALSHVIRAHLRLGQLDSARRIAESMTGPMRPYVMAQILSTEIILGLGSAKTVLTGQQLYKQPVCASILSRTGHFDEAIELLVRALASAHSAKAHYPSLWGKPRIAR
jgi:tetratricopeptide (TPR) repeat protein